MKENKTTLVAEIGINHNGDFDRMVYLGQLALNSGADLIKIQVKTPELSTPFAEWENPKMWFDGTMTTYIEYKKRMEFSEEQLNKLTELFPGRIFASVWDDNSLALYRKVFGGSIVKIPSAKIVQRTLMLNSANWFDHVIFSIGMSTQRMVETAIKEIERAGRKPRKVTILDCHSAYPTPKEEINLNRFMHVQSLFGNKYDIGYSSHSPSIYPMVYTSVLGATMVEAHFTDDRSLPGTDQASSLDANSFTRLRHHLNDISLYKSGDFSIILRESEKPALRKLR